MHTLQVSAVRLSLAAVERSHELTHLLRRHPVPPCDVHHTHARCMALQHDPALGLVAPEPATAGMIEHLDPARRITINLAPANIRKEGPMYDLPIAVAVLMAGRTIEPCSSVSIADMLMAGELALDGSVRGIRGTTSMVLLGHQSQASSILVPASNMQEASIVSEAPVLAVHSLGETVQWMNGSHELTSVNSEVVPEDMGTNDFVEVFAQEDVKRALLIAAAGWHNMIMLGPPGSGKSMLARCLPGILPSLSDQEFKEVIQIRSCIGWPEDESLTKRPPFRSPHHSCTAAAVIGGGSHPRPGEISLAHNGILFLDELPEFPRSVLETLRQPLEEHAVTIARASGSVRYPARCLLIAAMNPTRDGRRAVRRSDDALMKISSPLLDRIDLHVEVSDVPIASLRRAKPGLSTRKMAGMVKAARERMSSRQQGILNGMLDGPSLDSIARFKSEALDCLEESIRELEMSARAWNRLRRVARTIADIDGHDCVEVSDVIEAIQYRSMEC